MSKDHNEFVLDMTRIVNRAVTKAQEENRRNGVPNVYSHRGTIYYELPDGTITMESPFSTEKQKKAGEAA